jgi:hypothetical protein
MSTGITIDASNEAACGATAAMAVREKDGCAVGRNSMADELTFHASRTKAALIMLGSIAFVAIGYFMRQEQPLLGWACMLFFGLGIPVGLVMLLSPNSTYLRLDAEGFEIGSFVKKTRIKWTDVAGFELASIRGAKMIAIIYAPNYEGQRIGRAVAGNLSGMEGAIANSYNAPLAKVLDTLNEWRARYGSRR